MADPTSDDFLNSLPLGPLGPQELGLPAPPMAPQMPVSGETPEAAHQRKMHALAGLAATLIGGKSSIGAGSAVIQHQQQIAGERKQQEARDQQLFNQQQQQFQREQQAYDADVERRRQQLIANVEIFKRELPTIRTKAEYDDKVEGFAQLMQQAGYRIDANWLRRSAKWTSPDFKPIATKALDRWTDANKEQIKEDPSFGGTGVLYLDSNADGEPEKWTIDELRVYTGAIGLDPETWKPMYAPAGVSGVKLGTDAKDRLVQLVEEAKAVGQKITPPLIKKLQDEAVEWAAQNEARAAKLKDQAVPKRTGEGGGRGADSGNPDDPETIAQGIMAGRQPPTLTGLYGKSAAVRAALERHQFNLAEATTDWQATLRHLATLNGVQQNRISQAVSTARDSLDVIDDLAKQWQGGKFPLLNKGRLMAAKQGVLGPEAQQIATQLSAQITDLVSELGNVYMGGNSPTDHALALAQKNLNADWTLAQLLSATQLARRNLQIRSNSIANAPVVGASPNNPYAQPGTPTAPVVPPAGTGPSYQDYLKSRGQK